MKSRYCSGVVSMLSEITGSLPATNVRDNIIRDIDTIHSTQSIANSPYGRRWTFNVRWTVIYLGLSEYGTLHHRFHRRWPCFQSWRHVAINLYRRRIPDASPHEHWTQSIARGTCTLNTARKQWTRNMNCQTEQPWCRQECANSIVSFCFFSYIPTNGTVLHIAMYRYCWLLKLCNSNFAECWCSDQCVTSPVYYCDSYVIL